jgi:hypothetical protein
MAAPGLEAPVSAATPEVALPPTKPSEILSAAADLIEPEGRWTKGAFARDQAGHIVQVESQNASCFCVAGAIYKVAGRRQSTRVGRLIDQLSAPLQAGGRYRGLADFNDHPERTQAEVVSALRQAAEKAREQGS